MDDGSWLSFLALAVLLLGAAYFALMESSFASVSRARVRARQEKGDAQAEKALLILDNFDRAITTILIGTNIIHLSAAAIVTVLVTKLWGTGAVVWGTLITTLVLFFAGEMLPKTIARKYSERICLRFAGSLCFFMRIFTPISAVLTAIGQGVAKLTPGNEEEVSVTEDELYDIIEDMTDAGSLEETQGDLVQSALEFGDVTVDHVLTARVDMAAVDATWPVDRVMDFIRSHRHSRLPVYDGTVDNIIGILQIRKYIKVWLEQGDSVELRSLLDEAYFVPAGTNVDALLPEMSKKRLNMAIVTDAWGGTLGLVTVEDILEELVGEIWDEEDVVEEHFQPLGGGRYEVDAQLDVDEVFELLGYEDPEDNPELTHKSLTEWTLEQFELMPAQRDKFLYHDLEFTVSDIYKHRIRKLIVRQLPSEPEEGGAEA
ncbi:MAG: hemolysin family protein [Oscillospiraceae bacterium]|nr:hemolysin family protein [Oscillospiraceae bacterium]